MSNEQYTLNGPSEGSVGVDYQYTITPPDGSAYNWSVENGEVVLGQGTPNINVRFTAPGNNKVNVNFRDQESSAVDKYVITGVVF